MRTIRTRTVYSEDPALTVNNYYIVYKPFMMLSQFTTELGKRTLADLDFKFPTDVYTIGRLDEDSEGFLILSNDKNLNYKLLDPKFEHVRTYLVQVDGAVTGKAIEELSREVEISIKGNTYQTQSCEAEAINEPDNIPERTPPIRFRKNIPTSWIKLSIKEGKNHQVRKMTAKVGFPTLRLIRYSTEQLDVNGMKPGEVKEIEKEAIYKGLNIMP
jgi:23S rRNA pseudouridine2457 synthase